MIFAADIMGGRTCLITGASSGLGAHFARLLAGAGANVVLAARRIDRIEALAAELAASGTKVAAVVMDVTDEVSVAAAFDTAEAQLGPIDTVIANAGVTSSGRATEVSADGIRGVFDANLVGVYLSAREGAKRMMAHGSRETGAGRIVLIGSITADHIALGQAAYAASKAGVATLGRNFAREWVRQGICVNVLQPGYIATELAKGWFTTDKGREQIAGFNRKRLQPIESLDPMMLYLCSDASAAMTGSVITLDDGQLL